MTLKALITLCLLSVVSLGRADIVILENANEVYARNLLLPSSIAGSLVLKECDTCTPITIRTSANSSYFIAGTEVSLEQFRTAFEQRASEENLVLAVLSDRKSGYVTRILMN